MQNQIFRGKWFLPLGSIHVFDTQIRFARKVLLVVERFLILIYPTFVIDFKKVNLFGTIIVLKISPIY